MHRCGVATTRDGRSAQLPPSHLIFRSWIQVVSIQQPVAPHDLRPAGAELLRELPLLRRPEPPGVLVACQAVRKDARRLVEPERHQVRLISCVLRAGAHQALDHLQGTERRNSQAVSAPGGQQAAVVVATLQLDAHALPPATPWPQLHPGP